LKNRFQAFAFTQCASCRYAPVVAKELPENAVLYGKYELFEKFPSTGLMILNMVGGLVQS
jgi:hypothetical protein